MRLFFSPAIRKLCIVIPPIVLPPTRFRMFHSIQQETSIVKV